MEVGWIGDLGHIGVVDREDGLGMDGCRAGAVEWGVGWAGVGQRRSFWDETRLGPHLEPRSASAVCIR